MAHTAVYAKPMLAAEQLNLLHQGYTPDAARTLANALLTRQASGLVAMQAYGDLFWVCMIITLSGLLAVPFLRGRVAAS